MTTEPNAYVLKPDETFANALGLTPYGIYAPAERLKDLGYVGKPDPDPFRTPVIPEYAVLWDQDDHCWLNSTDFCPRRPPRKVDDRNSWEFHGVIHTISARPAGENTYDGERDGGIDGDRGWVFTGSNGFGPAQHLFVSAPAARALGRLLLGLPQLPGDGELISETMERY
jgi:hypothetical protein